MQEPVLVTGAAGFAGSHLIDALASSGVSIVGWSRPGGKSPSPPRTPERDPIHSIRFDSVDLLDRRAVAAAISRLRPAAIYHCAGAAHVGRSWGSTEATFAINVRGTYNLIEALRDAGADCRVLIVSSSSVYAPANEPLNEDQPLLPSSPYGLSKLAQEMTGTAGRGPWVAIARAFNHIGPRQDPAFIASGFARRIADIEAGRWAPQIAVGNLETRRDITDVRDVVNAYRLILERGTAGRAYNVCSGHAVQMRELLNMMLAHARVPVEIKVDPERYRPNDTPLVVGSPDRIRDELGWSPTISLERSLDDLLEFWRAH